VCQAVYKDPAKLRTDNFQSLHNLLNAIVAAGENNWRQFTGVFMVFVMMCHALEVLRELVLGLVEIITVSVYFCGYDYENDNACAWICGI
jgi:hypothetical protein